MCELDGCGITEGYWPTNTICVGIEKKYGRKKTKVVVVVFHVG
jgi:hypothetical protein